MKKTTLAILFSLTPLASMAASDSELANEYFNKTNPKLSTQERAGLAIARKWQADSATGMKPVPGKDGTIRFQFGASQPSIVCAVMQVCDVELQAGEQVNSIHLGDTVRWTVEPAITGSGPYEVQHLILKPLDVGLETSLVVTTNRRTYHMRLRSHRTEFMPRVAFSYPNEMMAQWAALKNRQVKEQAKERAVKTLPATGEYLGDLNFNYTITGNAAWKPVRVYNDGTKTIIQMSSAMAQTEAPTLLVVRKDGGLFSDEETVIVNYRVQGDRYIVDTIFDKAIMITGIGSSQDRVTIEKVK